MSPPTLGCATPVELLLCQHHFRVSRAALLTAGAALYDRRGTLLSTTAESGWQWQLPGAAEAGQPATMSSDVDGPRM